MGRCKDVYIPKQAARDGGKKLHKTQQGASILMIDSLCMEFFDWKNTRGFDLAKIVSLIQNSIPHTK